MCSQMDLELETVLNYKAEEHPRPCSGFQFLGLAFLSLAAAALLYLHVAQAPGLPEWLG